MDDNMPTLKECILNNKELEDFGIKLLLLYSCGYSMQDFEKYVKQMLEDKDMKEAVEAMTPMLKYGLRELKRSLK